MSQSPRGPEPSPILPPLILLLLLLIPAAAQARDMTQCSALRSHDLLPADPARCAELEAVIRRPGALPLDRYEARLNEFLGDYCHRNGPAGWVRDKRVRDTGPFTAGLENGRWVGRYHGTHAPVVVWYSPEMVQWLQDNRAPGQDPAQAAPIPDGAIMIKEMFPYPAAACAGASPERLEPTSGAAVMIRDSQAAFDGWFWGWYGWEGWSPDWPADASNRYPYLGFGQYCVNCHASAENNLTFASLANLQGQPGQPLVYLSQHFFDAMPRPGHHRLVSHGDDDPPRVDRPRSAYHPDFPRTFPTPRPPDRAAVVSLPSQTYDNVWVAAGGPTVADQFLTSDQCIGCHDAGGTGLQFDMTAPDPHGDKLLNLSPYGTWRSSPMGLGGRDPVFLAQLASETETFHPEQSELLQDVCLGCHGVQGQRQYTLDHFRETGECGQFLRSGIDAIPYPTKDPQAARYGALARDGIACTACHRMVQGKAARKRVQDQPQNECVRQRQQLLNPDNEGFARTFTGSYLVGPPDELYGPFQEPKPKPMVHALGIEPRADERMRDSQLCGSCHTVHLPVLHRGRTIGHVYEQTTYPEWAFSAYRTGRDPDGPVPGGPGERARSCQDCHMPSRDGDGLPSRSKIAGIQEFSNFPETDHNLGPEDIDLPVREGFARHTLVGLNLFLVKMAQQFPEVLGIRTQDPMLTDKGLNPLLLTERRMLEQAARDTASIGIAGHRLEAGRLTATVRVTSRTGHKFPSGVGFRRAFIDFQVLDRQGEVLWASGRTNGAGVIVDPEGKPLAGELWWEDDCSARRHPGRTPHQPHYQTIRRQDQVQIYQELVSAPASVDNPQCGHEPTPGGELTTSFLSICGHVKDNRLLPHGFLPLAQRQAIARHLGAGPKLAEQAGPRQVGDDPDYGTGGRDHIDYEVELSQLSGEPYAVQATLYYQAMPPFYLQDRFCTSDSDDTRRLYFLAGHLDLSDGPAADWKLKVAQSGVVPVGVD